MNRGVNVMNRDQCYESWGQCYDSGPILLSRDQCYESWGQCYDSGPMLLSRDQCYESGGQCHEQNCAKTLQKIAKPFHSSKTI
jgi:hypothetical protein